MPESVLNIPSNRGIGDVLEKPFIRVVFQSGFPQEFGINGCRVEDVIEVAIERISRYQRGSLPCPENEEALRALKRAKASLDERVRRREVQGVLNTNAQHAIVRTEDSDHDFSATGS